MKKTVLVQGLVAAAAAALLISCGGGGGAPYANGGTGGNGGGNTVTQPSPDQTWAISVGYGDTIETAAQETAYRKRFRVSVASKTSGPIKGATVGYKVIPRAFAKGSWASGTQTATWCPREYLDDTLTTGTDLNGNGELDPRPSLFVATAENTNVTNAAGEVFITVDWPKNYASWVAFDLVAWTTGATGATEVTVRTPTGAGFVAGDQTKDSSAFGYSPFGLGTSCSNML